MSAYGTCPCCNGTGLVELSEKEKRYSWNKDKSHKECRNCGGQTMYGKATGKVPLRSDTGEPCVHEYVGQQKGRCYVEYTCKHCGHRYSIDSGD